MVGKLLRGLRSPLGKLRLSELRYRRLFETAQDGILILDADTGKIADVNPFLKELLGYSEAELIGKQLWEIGVFKDIVGSKAAFIELQTKGYIRYKDLPLQTKNGQVIDVEFVSNAYLVDSEKVIQCNIRDITNRKKAEEAVVSRAKELEVLTLSQEKTRRAMLNVMEDLEKAKSIIEIEKVKDEAMFASIGEGLIAVNNNRKIINVNKKTEDLLGWTAKELIGKVITTLRLESEDGQLISLEKRPTSIALATQETANVVYYFVKKDRTRFPLAINATPIILGGKTIGLIETLRDITRETEVDKAKSEFVSLASHQLRTPLGIIKWYLEALTQEKYLADAPTQIQGYFKEINKNNERVLSLVRDLLSVSRIDQGKVRNTPQSIDPAQVIREITEQLRIIADKKGIKLRCLISDAHLPAITIDLLRFHEVVENLIINAIEYTAAKGTVTVVASRIGSILSFYVKDTGIGISMTDQKKLFTKFFRTEKAVGYNPEGSGLGLYVVKSYVEGWGGTVAVNSAIGRGSTFTVSLPVYRQSSLKQHKKGGVSDEKNSHS